MSAHSTGQRSASGAGDNAVDADVTARIHRPVANARPAVSVKRRCGWCRRVLPEQVGRGRPKKFCGQACRQWDWVHRQRAEELELSENEFIVARDALDRLRDDLYVLSCAIEDTERDLNGRGSPTAAELRHTLDWLLEAAKSAATNHIAPNTR